MTGEVMEDQETALLERAGIERRSGGQAALLALVFAASLLILSPVSAQNRSVDAGLAAGPVDETAVARLQVAYETRLGTLFEKARETGTVRVMVQLRTPIHPEGLLNRAQSRDQRVAIAALQAEVVERLARRFDIDKTAVKRFETIPYFALAVDERQLAALRADPDVAAIETDGVKSPQLYQSGPLIHADVAHRSGYTGAGQVVAVLDSGVVQDHPFLAGKVVEEACYSGTNGLRLGTEASLCPGGASESTATGSARDCPPFVDGCGHGTFVAGIVAGNRVRTFFGDQSGIAPDAQIIAIKVVYARNDDDDGLAAGSANAAFFDSDIVRGLERVYALKDKYPIAAVNLSLGGGDRYSDTASCDRAESAYKAAIDHLRSAGIVTVVASGDHGWNDGLSSPGCISTVISVGATTKSDAVASYSNSASFLHLLAPGGEGELRSSTGRIFSSAFWPSAVSAGVDYTCGVKSDSTVACWGGNSYGQATPPAGPFLQVSAGDLYACGVRYDDDTVACWGLKGGGATGIDFGQATPPTGTFTQVSAGFRHTCGVRSDATVACWGDNLSGESAPPAGTFAQVSAGSGFWSFTCGLTTAGTVDCWGNNDDGKATPPAGTFTQVSAGGRHTCGLRSNGNVVCWGWNAASPVDTYTFTQVSASIGDHTCGALSNGAAVCWGDNALGQATPPPDLWAGFVFGLGTSAAAPHVAGAWAVLKSKKPTASISEILSALRTTGKPVLDSRNGYTFPRIDVAAALGVLDTGNTYTLTVGTAGTGSGTVTGTGISCGSDCTESYASGTSVMLTATPSGGSTFTGWSGACSGTGACAVTMNSAKSVIATFDAAAPTVTTNAASGVTATGSTLNGTVSSNGASTTATFRYGLTTNYGSSATAAQSPLAAGAAGAAVSAAISGLACNTLYHFRAVGANTVGTTNGADASFTTAPCSGDDNFPPGGQMPGGWTKPSSANTGWVVASGSTYRGPYSLKSAAIGNDQSAAIQVSGTFDAGDIAFAVRVSSESDYDFLQFYVDDELVGSGSGEIAWTPLSYTVTAGPHTFKWVYVKDGSESAGADAAWIDSVVLPPVLVSAYSRNYVQKAYVAYYGRPADPGGQNYWASRMDAEGGSLNAIIAAFGNSAEFDRRYGGLSYSDLVTKIYQQALGRNPDPAGLAYYVGELQAGRRTLQSITLDVLNGATTAPDSTVVANKLDVAAYYTAKVASGCSYGTEQDGANALSGVTAVSATVTAGKAAIDSRCGP